MKNTQRIALITVAALLVVVGVWYVALWRPAQSHIDSLRAQQVTAAANVETLQAQVDVLRAQERRLPAERAALVKLDEAIPADPGLDQLLKVVDNAVAEAGMTLTSIGTPPPSGWGTSGAAPSSATAGPQSITVSIGVLGSDTQMLRLVTDLNSEPRLFVVNSLTLDSLPGSATPASSAGVTTGAGTSGSSASDGNTYSVSVTAFFVSGASNNPVFPGTAVGG